MGYIQEELIFNIGLYIKYLKEKVLLKSLGFGHTMNKKHNELASAHFPTPRLTKEPTYKIQLSLT